MKRLLKIFGVALAGLLIAAFLVLRPMIMGNLPATHGEELAPGVFQLVDGYVSVFALDAGEGRFVLVDAGNDPEGKAILGWLGSRGLGPSAVRAIVLTHGHPDHIAGAHLFPEAALYAFAGDTAIVQGEGRAKGPLPRLMDTPVEKRARVTHTLTDGQAVVVGTATVTAYAVPGHTAGSAAFVYGSTVVLGDNANGKTDGTVVAAPWVVSDDTAENLRSLGALRTRLAARAPAIDVLAFAHSGPMRGAGVLDRLPR